MSEQQFVEIAVGDLLDVTRAKKAQGWRFVQCHAMRGADEGTFDVMYTFSDDAALELVSYVLHLDAPEAQPAGQQAQASQGAEADAEVEDGTGAEDNAEVEGKSSSEASGVTPADVAEPETPPAPKGPSVPSLGELYPGAFMFENEMHDLFGIEVSGMTLDYRGGFYHLHIPNPMAEPPEKPAKKTPAARPAAR